MIHLTNTRLISQSLTDIIPPITPHHPTFSSFFKPSIQHQSHHQHLNNNKFYFSSIHKNSPSSHLFKSLLNPNFLKLNYNNYKFILSCYKEGINADNTNNTTIDYKAGRMCYQPKTFESLLEDACAATIRAINDGEKKLEIEFPPLPGSVNGMFTFNFSLFKNASSSLN